MDLATTVG